MHYKMFQSVPPGAHNPRIMGSWCHTPFKIYLPYSLTLLQWNNSSIATLCLKDYVEVLDRCTDYSLVLCIMQQKAEVEPWNETSAYQVIWEKNAVVVIAYAVSL